MKKRTLLVKLYACMFIYMLCTGPLLAHDIIFCGEHIPVENGFVADKLMNVIRTQIPNVNLPSLSKKARAHFPVIEYYLKETGLPLDFKYLAIVESGFRNISSSAGAQGVWQLMPETAADMGLTVNASKDDRNNIYKSTYAACKVLADYYLQIRKKYGVSSWVLTAAAYNFGIGNMAKAISRQGKDYFSMRLNDETANYVYRIIAVKELFEYPELYMKDFGYNVFTASISSAAGKALTSDTSAFNTMTVNVKEDDGEHPEKITADANGIGNANKLPNPAKQARFVAANIKGKYKNFADGETISIELFDDLSVKGTFNSKGNVLLGKGWIIDDRIFVDLGYGDHEVIVMDNDYKKGIRLSSLKNKEPVLLKVQEAEE